MTYTLENGRTVRIPDTDIERLVKGLHIDKEDAIIIWLEDNEYLVNEEQNELDQKAKASGITRTIHCAKADKPKQKRKVERKADTTKESLVADLAEFLSGKVENVQIANVGKLITFSIGNENFKLDLIRQRPPKK